MTFSTCKLRDIGVGHSVVPRTVDQHDYSFHVRSAARLRSGHLQHSRPRCRSRHHSNAQRTRPIGRSEIMLLFTASGSCNSKPSWASMSLEALKPGSAQDAEVRRMAPGALADVSEVMQNAL